MAKAKPAQRILFVIRGKLGDSLIPYATVRAYIDAHPDHEVWLLIRKAYAGLLQGEQGVRIVTFNRRIDMMAKLAWIRLTRPAFDVLAVLWGFGRPMLRIAQLVRAHRKIYLDDSFAAAYPEWPALYPYENHADRAWRVTQVFDPEIARPVRLAIPSLAARRQTMGSNGVVAVVPAADEDRRTLDVPTLMNLLQGVIAQHSGQPVWLIVNPRDRGAGEFMTAALPAGVELKHFSTLEELLDLICHSDHYYGMDTGVYHLAVSMGIQATVFFGPTQPLIAIMPEQTRVVSLRLAVLKNDHCNVLDCACPLCLYQTVDSYFDANCATPLAATPQLCPLRAFDPADLPAITLRRHPPA